MTVFPNRSTRANCLRASSTPPRSPSRTQARPTGTPAHQGRPRPPTVCHSLAVGRGQVTGLSDGQQGQDCSQCPRLGDGSSAVSAGGSESQRGRIWDPAQAPLATPVGPHSLRPQLPHLQTAGVCADDRPRPGNPHPKSRPGHVWGAPIWGRGGQALAASPEPGARRPGAGRARPRTRTWEPHSCCPRVTTSQESRLG